jgi:uncharacterized protein
MWWRVAMEEGRRRRVTLSELRRRRADLYAIARRHGVSNIRVFGSVARADADDASDLDRVWDFVYFGGILPLIAWVSIRRLA